MYMRTPYPTLRGKPEGLHLEVVERDTYVARYRVVHVDSGISFEKTVRVASREGLVGLFSQWSVNTQWSYQVIE